MKVKIIKEIADNVSSIYYAQILISSLIDMTDEDIYKVIKKLKECNYFENVIKIITNGNLLNGRSLDEILLLIDKYQESNYEKNIYWIINDINIIQNNTTKEMLKIIDIYVSSNYDTDILNIIKCDAKANVRNIIKKIEESKSNVFESIKEINTIDKLKEYADALDDLGINQINQNTYVPKYILKDNKKNQ